MRAETKDAMAVQEKVGLGATSQPIEEGRPSHHEEEEGQGPEPAEGSECGQMPAVRGTRSGLRFRVKAGTLEHEGERVKEGCSKVPKDKEPRGSESP